MSERKHAHTPGPWIGGIEKLDEIRSEQTGMVVCTIRPVDPIGVIVLHRTISDANSKLIAAAPELLDALQDALAFGTMSAGKWLDEKVRAAIAKAT